MRRHLGTLVTGTLAVGLAVGWSLREAQFARAAGKRVPNTTLNTSDIKFNAATDAGKTVGKAGVYLDGETEGTTNFMVGKFVLNPGAEPHPPHTHPEEEVLIVTKGSGEILCNGKTTTVKPGAVMYSDPNVPHGIKNTGGKTLEFYWVKYAAKSK